MLIIFISDTLSFQMLLVPVLVRLTYVSIRCKVLALVP